MAKHKKFNLKNLVLAFICGVALLAASLLITSPGSSNPSSRGWPLSFFTPSYTVSGCNGFCVNPNAPDTHNSFSIDYAILGVDLVFFEFLTFALMIVTISRLKR